MTPIKYSINFFLNKKEGSETAPLRFRIVWGGGLRLSLNVGYSIDINGWNQSEQRCLKKSLHGKKQIPAQVINRTIEKITTIIEDAFAKFENQGKIPTKEELKETIDPSDDKNKLISFYFKQFIQEGKIEGWSIGSIKKMRTMRKHLESFNKNLTFQDIENESFYVDILQYFLNKGIKNETTKKYIKNIQWFIRWAKARKLCDCSDFLLRKSKLRTAKKPIIYLTWEELMSIYNHDYSNHKCFDAVRDAFCFACFTSLRFSDVKNLKKQNVTDKEIIVTTQKTNNTIIIDLNKYSKAILDKYKDNPTEYALPTISSQKSNEYLKEIAKECDIDAPVTITTFKGNERYEDTYPKYELISFHAGRRTFISNALMLGIPPNIVMKWSGHASYKSMMPYIEIADEAKRKAMTAFDKQ